jgi:hypothetical protein
VLFHCAHQRLEIAQAPGSSNEERHRMPDRLKDVEVRIFAGGVTDDMDDPTLAGNLS